MTAKEQLRHQWQARIAEYRTSGLTLKAWCAAHGCTVDQMKYWLYKTKKRAPSGSAVSSMPTTRFVPLAVADEEKAAPLVLRIGPVRIDLQTGFDPRLLREVVHALAEATPC